MPDADVVAGPPASPADSPGPVGFVGLGMMGLPMSARLAAAGFRVLGHDPDPGAADRAADRGVHAVASVADVVRGAQTVILMLPTSAVVEAVVTELLAVPPSERRCRALVDMSSSEPTATVALAARLADEGIALVDAPVSGGVVGAESGRLTIMVGGDAALVAQVRPLLEGLGTAVTHVGSVGSGHALKALNNLMSAAHLLVTDEAMVTATRFGIDPELALAVVNQSSGRSGSTDLKLPRYVVTGTFDSGFSAALLEKDVRIATSLAAQLGVEATLSEAVLARWSQLRGQLSDHADHTEIVKPMETQAGTQVRRRPAP